MMDTDGARIDTSYFTAGDPDTKRPAILIGHGFGGSKADVRKQAEELAQDGYAVLTWSARGFGKSTGKIGLNDPKGEVADARKLIDWLATRPEVRLDKDGDPRVGMTGACTRERCPCSPPGTTGGWTRSPPDHVLEPRRRPVPRRRLQEAVGRSLHQHRWRLREVREAAVRHVRAGRRGGQARRGGAEDARRPQPGGRRRPHQGADVPRPGQTDSSSRSARATPSRRRSARTARPSPSTGSRAATTAATASRTASRAASTTGSTAT